MIKKACIESSTIKRKKNIIRKFKSYSRKHETPKKAIEMNLMMGIFDVNKKEEEIKLPF
jgi:hypothetical protein